MYNISLVENSQLCSLVHLKNIENNCSKVVFNAYYIILFYCLQILYVLKRFIFS